MPVKPTYEELEQRVAQLERAEHKRKQAAIDKQENEVKFRALLDTSVDAITIIDLETGKFIDCNNAAVILHDTGSRDNLIGLTPAQLSPQFQPNGELSENLSKDYIRTAFSEGAKVFEWTHCKRDGRTFPAYVTLIAIVSGKKHLVMAIVRDVTDSKKAEERIKKLNRLNEALLISGNLNDKLKLITDSVIDIFHADFARIWLTKAGDLCDSGCVHAQVVDGPHVCKKRNMCLHLISSSGRYTHIDGRHGRVPFGCYKIGRIASEEEPKFVTNDVVNDTWIHDYEWARNLELKSFCGYRLLSESGSPVGVFALFSKHEISPEEDSLLENLSNSIAQVIQTEGVKEALRESERRLAGIIDFLPDPTWVIDINGQVIAWNRAMERASGINRKDIVGKSNYEYSVPFYGERRPVLIDLILKRDVEWEKKYLTIKEDNGMVIQSVSFHPSMGEGGRYYSAAAARLYNPDGSVIGAIESIRDITDAKLAEQENERLINELKEAFAKVQTLSGLLPICSSCKKIRDDKGYWKQIEFYISEHSQAEFSHGICPDCIKKNYPDLADKVLSNLGEKPEK